MIWLAVGVIAVSALMIAGFEIGALALAKPTGWTGERWHELEQEDPADHRCHAVRDAYARGEFGPEELDWRILLALQPPDPLPRQRHEAALREAMTDLWIDARAARVVPIYSGATIVAAEPLPTKPDPRLVERREII